MLVQGVFVFLLSLSLSGDDDEPMTPDPEQDLSKRPWESQVHGANLGVFV